MILDARKTPAQRRYNEPKIIETLRGAQSRELTKTIMSKEFSKLMRVQFTIGNPIVKKCPFFKKMVAEGPQFRVPSHMGCLLKNVPDILEIRRCVQKLWDTM